MIKTLLLGLLVSYASLALIALLWSDRFIFLPPTPSYDEHTLPVRLVPGGDGHRIAVLYLARPGSRHTLLFSHGNGEDLGHNRAFFARLREAGFSVLAYDYAGYGLSEGGPPGEQATYRNIEAVHAYATQELGIAPESILVHGRSVGTGPSLHLAVTRPVGGVILESGFTSAFRVLTRIALLPGDRFVNLARIRTLRVPVLVIHGTHDEVVPYRMGRQLFEAAAEPKSKLWVERAGHNDVASVGGDAYYAALRDFAARLR